MTILGGLACIVLLAAACGAQLNATVPSSDIDKCEVSGNSTLDECLERFSHKWDEIRKEKPQVDALAFPIVAMTPEELKPLCSRIGEAQDACGKAVETCQTHEITRFLQQNFIYGCKQKQGPSLFAEHTDCLLTTITGQQQCLTLLKKSPDEPNACSQVEHFFKCVHDEVYRSCQAKGLAALVHAIDRYGCDIKNLDARVENTKDMPPCTPPDWQAVATCFQPLLSLWAELRDNNTKLLETAFPIFNFDRSDLTKMCDIVRSIRDQCFVQIQRCPGHQFPEFANAILGLACGTQQSTFFLNYDCIRNAIFENEQCHPYTVGAWQPGHLKETCGRMPQFYKCLERPITDKCGPGGITVLTQAIRQYGCDLNTDSAIDSRPPAVAAITSEATTTSTAAVTTTAPLPLTEGVLDFAASPPSHSGLPPAPQSNLQPFLQEFQLQPSFFLGAPVPSPLGPETFFNQNLAPGRGSKPAPAATIQPAPSAAILLEPQQAPAGSGILPLPEPFAPVPATRIPAAANLSSIPTTPSTTSSTSGPTSPITPSTSAPSKGVVVPIPNVPRLLELCTLEKQNQLRECLNPLYRRWVDVHGKMMEENHGLNLTLPIFHYAKADVVELCDHYASAFLRCPFSLFQQCLTDEVVFLANSIFGYVCSPQNVGDFSRYFDCLSVVVRQRTQCTEGVTGALLTVARGSSARCQGAQSFYSCNKWQIEQSCTTGAEKVFAETLRQFGCELPH